MNMCVGQINVDNIKYVCRTNPIQNKCGTNMCAGQTTLSQDQNFSSFLSDESNVKRSDYTIVSILLISKTIKNSSCPSQLYTQHVLFIDYND